jgi:hypothetical protein
VSTQVAALILFVLVGCAAPMSPVQQQCGIYEGNSGVCEFHADGSCTCWLWPDCRPDAGLRDSP